MTEVCNFKFNFYDAQMLHGRIVNMIKCDAISRHL